MLTLLVIMLTLYYLPDFLLSDDTSFLVIFLLPIDTSTISHSSQYIVSRILVNSLRIYFLSIHLYTPLPSSLNSGAHPRTL
jgi:hypothetical protein